MEFLSFSYLFEFRTFCLVFEIRTNWQNLFRYDMGNMIGKVGGSVDELTKFQQNVRFFRKEKGWSQGELAEKLNVTRAVISKLETGMQPPSVEMLIQLSTVLEVSIDHLLGRGEMPNLLTEVFAPYRTEKHLQEVVDYIIKHSELYDALEQLAQRKGTNKKLVRFVSEMIKEAIKLEE